MSDKTGRRAAPSQSRAKRASVPSSDTDPCWHELPDAFLSESGTVHVREPEDANLTQVQWQLRRGRYAKPFVFDDGEMLRLHFNLRYVQSAMRLDAPDELVLEYTQKMMAFLLFRPNPRHVVVVGMGGGSLSKFCYQHLPRTRVTTLEINAEVIGFAELFRIPPPNARMRIVHGDAVEYFAGKGEATDAILIDGCDRRGVAAAFCTADFYRNLRRRLRPGGIVVVNLIGGTHNGEVLRRTIAEVFDSHVLSLKVQVGGNRVLFAFNGSEPAPRDWPAIRDRAEGLSQALGLDFPAYAQNLQRSARR